MESYGLGSVVDQLDDLQPAIVEAVRDTGRMGRLTLTLTYKRVGLNTVAVGATVAPVIPRQALQAVEMFADDNNGLHEEDPAQFNFENIHSIDKKKTVHEI